MDRKGYLSLILHAHLPYVRHPEHPDFLEEHWLFEALTESYLPLLIVLDGLSRDGVDFRLALSITPTLVSMLDDPLLKERYRGYLDRLVELAEKETLRQRFDPPHRQVAEFYLARFESIRAFLSERCGGEVTGAFRRAGEDGKVELLASAATHALLPLFKLSPAAVRAQVRVGIDHHRKTFGREPAGFWLPECGYFPGLDELLAEAGIRYFVLETQGVLRGSTRARYGAYAPISCPSGVAAFARDPDSSKQVWSAQEGYPGHPDYRDFYRDIGFDLPLDYIGRYIGPDDLRIATGIKYHRITGRRVAQKQPYDRQRALERAAEHAGDFLRCRREQTEALSSRMDRTPLIVAPYDAELFGHWWFEGPEWLDALFRGLDRDPRLVAVTPSEYLAEYPQAQLSVPSMSTWGKAGSFQTWVNEATAWIFPPLHRACLTMGELASRHRGGEGIRRRVLNQAARELLLAQASDWPFILKSGTATGYARRRLEDHLARFQALASLAERGELTAEEERTLRGWEEQAPIFPDLRFEVFVDGGVIRRWALPREPRRVAFIAAEAAPYVKVGGLADVIGALPAALGEIGLSVLVVLPGYRAVDRESHRLRPLRQGLTVELGGKEERFDLLEAQPPAPGVRVLFIDHPGYFDRPGIYTDPANGEEYPDSTQRFIFFTRAALETLRLLGEPLDVVHCHDHQTALTPAYLKMRFAEDPVLGRAASVLTIHNLGYQGIASREAFALAGLGVDPLAAGSPFEHWGKVNLLKAGVVLADKVNVVSEGYAREVCSDPDLGAGLEKVLSERGADLWGILNGIDVREWNPASDPYLPRAYRLDDLEGKLECKRQLRQKVGLSPDRNGAPLVGMITRLVEQKGMDLICDALDQLLELGVDLVVLGTGQPKYQEYLQAVARAHPDRVAAVLRFDNSLAHLIEAGADMFLMPSLYEPCGLNQMYSLRYGTVPVVRSTGGLADTVVDDDRTGSGNGFAFSPYRSDALVDALKRALQAYRSPERWRKIVRAGMSADHSWPSSAGRYLDLYREALLKSGR
jgi:1,4-alpha-glucan branching enzyme